ncbi:hypothetical protein DSL64_09595 [Dyadobacter luteus]|uniref:Secretion system C-terminal sorting domain-containing protein n=1 Tax=Dyadobacter luteus TaxID=2259619 RepID=A0A3D8YDH4_9BACT|nr:T9SS type A sorting domain-containing protein [Dyadobacter luteus]REA62492.1 hypothetical protein DSL64_09595 [Dyadobacter luteus]
MKIDKTILFVILCFSSVNKVTGQTLSTSRIEPVGFISYISGSVNEPITEYVDGYVKNRGEGRLIFPVGDNGKLRPFAADGLGVIGSYFAANPSIAVTSDTNGGDYIPLPSGAPFNINSMGMEVARVSAQEYWDINGDSNSKITLSWDSESDIAGLLAGEDLSKLLIVGWDGGKWIKVQSVIDPVSILGNSSSVSSGSLTSVIPIVPSSYNVYTFGVARGALPVNLINFKGLAIESKVQLNWETSAEKGSDYFEIQRSGDKGGWVTLDKVIAARNSNITHSYYYLDTKPLYGQNLYRLKMVDQDQSYAYSNIIQVRFDESNGERTVLFPNPATSKIYVKSRSSDISGVKLLSLTGTLYYSGLLPSDGLDVETIPRGQYIFVVFYKDQASSTHKVSIR